MTANYTDNIFFLQIVLRINYSDAICSSIMTAVKYAIKVAHVCVCTAYDLFEVYFKINRYYKLSTYQQTWDFLMNFHYVRGSISSRPSLYPSPEY